MQRVRRGVLIGLIGQAALLVVLAGTVGLGGAGVLVALAYAGGVHGLLLRALVRSGARSLGPASAVTLTRAVLVGGVAALVAGSFPRPAPLGVLIGLAATALALDAVDGRVARRTGSVTAVGARFDMEVDSFLVLVLSVAAAGALGPWVLALGVPRYVFGAAGRALPWLRRPVPPRYWRKVVAAVQGITLTAVAGRVLPPAVAVATLLVVGALLAESFGRDVWWLWRRRRVAEPHPVGPVPAGRRMRAGTATAAAVLVVWGALLVPDRLDRLTPEAFLRIPGEGLLLVGLALVLPARLRRVLAPAFGVLLGGLVLLNVVDMGVYEELRRPFDPMTDWSHVGSAVVFLRDSLGRTQGDLAVVVAGLLVVVVLAGVILAVGRVCRAPARRRAAWARPAGALGGVWLVCAVLGVQVVPGVPVASWSASRLAADRVGAAAASLADLRTFGAALAAPDPYAAQPAAQLLSGLRGKDVIVAFVESFGRVAVEGSTVSPRIARLLTAGTQTLGAAGFSSRSAFLTSPTFAGVSWLAHSTLQSGLWVDSQQRYDQLVASDRLTLAAAFAQAGWRTVVDVPSNRDFWPEARSFYRFDQQYNRHQVGYAGPKFGFAAMPDQYTLAAFQRRELAPGHAPVMAEIDLVSSHAPWTPLPRMVPWEQLGDGSGFHGMGHGQPTADEAWRDADQVRALYGRSIEYSLSALISFVTRLSDHDLVLVLLGDHQPATIVSGPGADHGVPISIVASDPAVLDRIGSWGWDDGLLPSPQAPVWRMDAFRDRFLAAFGPAPSLGPVPMAHAPR